MHIRFKDFDLNKSIVAPVIYKDEPHQTTNHGVELSRELRKELRSFLEGFNASVGVNHVPYYRIDAYFDENTLWILEINASFVDGWGTALNLARASGIPVDVNLLDFPIQLATMNKAYMAELILFYDELRVSGKGPRIACLAWPPTLGKFPTYVYGRVDTKDPLIFPQDGIRLDNKLNLGLFSRTWEGALVRTPQHYVAKFQPWDEVPSETVLKFCDKGSPECERAGRSVLFGKPSGKAPFIKRCYNTQVLLGQNMVQATRENDKNCQLIILAVGNEPVTGYVQYGRGKLINDNSVHGPLQIG